MTRAALAAIPICAIILGACLLLFRGSRESIVSRGENPSLAPERRSGSEVAEPKGEPLQASGLDESGPGRSAAPLELRGALVLVDVEGVEHPEEDGKFLILRSESGEEPLAVQVVSGKWRIEWPARDLPREIHVMGIEAGGTEAEAEGRMPVSPEGDVSIRARWLPPTTVLEVVAKDTGKHLEDLTIIAYRGNSLGNTPHGKGHGPEQILFEGVKSPVRLESSPLSKRRPPMEAIWARAPGYAWGSAEVDRDRGGEYLLALDRAATLVVAIEGAKRSLNLAEPASILVYLPPAVPGADVDAVVKDIVELAQAPEAKDALAAEIASLREVGRRIDGGCSGEVLARVRLDATGPTTIEGLAPGSRVVCIETGGVFEDGIVLGSSAVDLVRGETTRVVLTLADIPELGAPAAFGGTLHVPSSWGAGDPYLAAYPLGMAGLLSGDITVDVEAVPGSPGTYEWKAGKVPPGHYEVRVSLDDFELSRFFEVLPQGKLDADIEVGDPVEVRVRVVNAETGQDIEETEVSWSCAIPGRSAGTDATEGADFDDATREHVFRAPSGRVVIEASTEVHAKKTQVVDVAAGTERVTIVLEKSCGIVITLEGPQLSDPGRFEAGVHVESVGGSGRMVDRLMSRRSLTLLVDLPGLYEVRLPTPDGFLPTEPMRIQVPRGEIVERTVLLERR